MRSACRIQPPLSRPEPKFGRELIRRMAMHFSPQPMDGGLASVGELLRRRAVERPNQTAFVFLTDPSDGAGGEVRWTFAELDRRACAVAAAIGQQAEPGDRAVLVFPPGLDFLAAFFGCLYAGVLPAPATYPKPRRPSPRLDAIVEDCDPKLVLTTADTLAMIDLAEQSPAVRSLAWVAVDQCAAADSFTPVVRRPNDAAFLQYTSGSTSEPRGVVVSHGNLLHNLELIREGFGLSAASNGAPPAKGVFWLPAYHDMGLIGGILTPLYVGGTSYLLAPATFLQRPLAWLETLARTRAAISGAPNFAYELCTRKTSPAERAGLDLSAWRLAFCGAEPIDASTLQEFAEAFAPSGFRSNAFYPCYGLAEATLMVTGGAGPGLPRVVHANRALLATHELVDAGKDSGGQPLVSCGRPLGDQDVVIVDPQTRQPRPAGSVGEIWVHGRSIAAGYWNHPEEMSTTFGGRLPDGNGPYLRTGDLGSFLDGELFVTGRLKDVIIIRGRNLYPQDIERTVQQAHEAVDFGAAFSAGEPGHEELVVVHQVGREHRKADMAPVIRAIRAAVVEEYEVDPQAIVLLKPTALPLTSSGKVQRGRCREMFESGELDEVGRWTRPAEAGLARGEAGVAHADEGAAGARRPKFLDHLPTYTAETLTPEIERWMMAWLAERVEAPGGELSPEATFAELGIDSLTAVELNVEFEHVLGLRLPPAAAWSYPTPAALSQFLSRGLLSVGTSRGPDGEVVDSWFEAMDADGRKL